MELECSEYLSLSSRFPFFSRYNRKITRKHKLGEFKLSHAPKWNTGFFLPCVTASDNSAYLWAGEVDCTIFVISICHWGLVLSWSVVKAWVQKDSLLFSPGKERGAQNKACVLTAWSARRGGCESVSKHTLAKFKYRGTFCDYTFSLSCLMAPPVTLDTSIPFCILYHH